MAHYLVYYKEYWNDIKEGYSTPTGNWTTQSQKFYKSVRPRDTLWAVVFGEIDGTSKWCLVERIQIARVDPIQSETKWGEFHLIGDKKKSQIFPLKGQPDLTPILWMLKFPSGKRIRQQGPRIGQALQANGFRQLAESAAILLEEYAQTIESVLKVKNKSK